MNLPVTVEKAEDLGNQPGFKGNLSLSANGVTSAHMSLDPHLTPKGFGWSQAIPFLRAL